MKILVVLTEDSKTAASIIVDGADLTLMVFNESFRERLRAVLREVANKGLPVRREVQDAGQASYLLEEIQPGHEGYDHALLFAFRDRGFAAALVSPEYQEALSVLAGETYSEADRKLFWSRVSNL